MVLSLNTMSMDAFHGGSAISSCYQPCQMQLNISEEIRKICTSMIARCTTMSATLNEWVSELEGAEEKWGARIEEDANESLAEKAQIQVTSPPDLISHST